jgi:hypothetical protein
VCARQENLFAARPPKVRQADWTVCVASLECHALLLFPVYPASVAWGEHSMSEDGN